VRPVAQTWPTGHSIDTDNYLNITDPPKIGHIRANLREFAAARPQSFAQSLILAAGVDA